MDEFKAGIAKMHRSDQNVLEYSFWFKYILDIETHQLCCNELGAHFLVRADIIL